MLAEIRKILTIFIMIQTKRILMLALLMLVTWVASYGQEVTGTIVDETGEPLIGVHVRDKVNNINAITDAEGKFSVKVPKGGATLTVTYMGMKTIIQKL